MRISLSWLRELVPIDVEPDALAERLSVSGFAVEEMIRTGAGISGVVVGEVRAMREHPNSDKLMLVRTFDGTAERDIVCGARNYAVGDRVPLALPGARLPNGMEIAQRTVRGEVSDGMLCSAAELHLSEDHSGILILDRGAAVGADLVRALDIDDVIFHLDVTTNRGDALSVLGIAREVAALYGLPLTPPDPPVPEGDLDVGHLTSVTIEDPKGCPRYLARVIEGVTVAPSPWWMRRRLLAAGMRPISNVVDVTNYVLLERGHPLHAFDMDRLAEGRIVVRHARKGERIRTLDDVDRALERTDVLICDAERPVAIAGIMGGGESEVSDATTRILLESAYFDPLRIRATAGRLKLRTEASMRFERGADPEGVPAAAARAAGLLAELTGGTVARGAVDVYPRPPRIRAIRMRVARASELLGTPLAAEEMAASLRALGCAVEASRATLKVTPPTWRPDLGIEEDLVEEVARIHGYDAIPEALPPGARAGGLTPEQRLRRTMRHLLLGAGLNEAQTQSLITPSIAERVGAGEGSILRRAFRVANPLSEDESVLRPSILPGLLLAAQRNAARRVLPVALFESGVVFGPDDGSLVERQEAAFVLGGPAPEGWHGAGRALDFFDAKGVAECVLAGLGIGGWDARAGAEDGWIVPLHPGRAATIAAEGRPVAVLGELHPAVAEEFQLPERTCVGVLDVAALVALAGEARVVVPPRQPAVARAVAIVVPDETPAAEVRDAIARAGGPLLESVDLFDVYRGDPIPEGRVSLAFGLSFRDPERTLTDADADAAMAAIREAAAGAGWAVRD